MSTWVRFPIDPKKGPENPRTAARPRTFADSGEASMAAAAERYLARREGVIGVPPMHSAGRPGPGGGTAGGVPSGPDDASIRVDALRGAVSLGMKRKEAENILENRVPKPWPRDVGALLAMILRYR